MGDLVINLNKGTEHNIAMLAGPLDNRTADGFDTWLRKYADHFGASSTIYLDMTGLEVLSSRAISSIVYYYDLFKNGGGKMQLFNVPPPGMISLEKLGFGNLDLLGDGPPAA